MAPRVLAAGAGTRGPRGALPASFLQPPAPRGLRESCSQGFRAAPAGPRGEWSGPGGFSQRFLASPVAQESSPASSRPGQTPSLSTTTHPSPRPRPSTHAGIPTGDHSRPRGRAVSVAGPRANPTVTGSCPAPLPRARSAPLNAPLALGRRVRASAFCLLELKSLERAVVMLCSRAKVALFIFLGVGCCCRLGARITRLPALVPALCPGSCSTVVLGSSATSPPHPSRVPLGG